MMDASANGSVTFSARLSFAARIGLLALVLVLEKILLTYFVDIDSAWATTEGEFLRHAQYATFRLLVSFGAALALFVYVRYDHRLAVVNAAARDVGIRWRWLIVNGALLPPLILLSYSLYGHHGLKLPFGLVATLWLACALSATLSAGAAIASWPLWQRAARALGSLWLYAGICAIAAVSVLWWIQKLWVSAAALTFDLVYRVLSPFIATLQADPLTRVLSTSQFSVEVTERCSGLEGLALMLAFCVAWLVFLRDEYVWPRALILIPLGLLLSFALNVVRIAVLMVIGHAGYPDVAMYGFHSQAGWIAFNLIACGIAFFSRRSRWLNRTAQSERSEASANPTAAYLIPFLAILAGGIVARAASGGFETLYALRPVAAALALAIFWRGFASLNWRFSWRGPAAGVAVFGGWIIGAHFILTTRSIPEGLAAMSPGARGLWIAIRIAAAVITVPVAEELAFRGFLMRRIVNADFESVPFGQVSAMALLVSSIVFGSLHGALWLLALAAGVVYGLLVMRTGRIGEAVAAHATTNALLAAYVLAANQWQLW
jgi:exosortase E/protease (VPEID-CTERM system)